MAEKSTKLSIVIATVDKATAKIKAINEELDKASKPVNDFKKALGELKEKSGLGEIVEGFKGVGDAVKESLLHLLEMGAIVGEAAHLIIELAEHFEDLGTKAKRAGVDVDFLAGLRDSALRAGVPVEALDGGMQALSKSLGQARAGTGRMAKFLEEVYPPLLRQIKAAKSNEEAFNVLADAMAKLKDPAKQAALAAATVSDPSFAPLLVQGSKALKEQAAHYLALAGSQKEAVEKGTELGEGMNDLRAASEGVKAALVVGLGPALTVIIKQITDWLVGHQADVAAWASSLGEKLPAAFNAVVGALKGAIDWVKPFVDEGWKLKAMALAVAGVLVGPLISAFASLGVAVLSSPIGLEIAAWTAAAVAAVAAITAAVKAGRWLGEKAAFSHLKNEYMVEQRELAPDMSDDEIEAAAEKKAAYDIAAQHAKEDADDRRAQAAIDNPSVSPQAAAAMAPEVSTQARSAFDAANAYGLGMPPAPAQPPAQAAVSVVFKNTPSGARVTTDPKSTARVDLSIGYQIGYST